MNLKIILPHEVFLDEKVEKIVAEGHNGYFGLLPKHIDFVSALTAGILCYLPQQQNTETFIAVDEGVLLKRGSKVIVSTRRAIKGKDLGSLEQTVHEKFHKLTDEEKRARSAMARLESTLARRFIEVHTDA